MMNHVENIRTRVVDGAEDPTNAVKRLRDFAKTVERLDPTALELVALLRSAADELLTTVGRPDAAAA